MRKCHVASAPETVSNRGRGRRRSSRARRDRCSRSGRRHDSAAGPRSLAARSSSADTTGQMSWHGASKKVRTTAWPRSSASDMGCPAWSSSENPGARPRAWGDPHEFSQGRTHLRRRRCRAGRSDRDRVADVVAVDWPAGAASGLRPTLESRCSSSVPPTASTTRTATTIKANFGGTLGSVPAKGGGAFGLAEQWGGSGCCSCSCSGHVGAGVVPAARCQWTRTTASTPMATNNAVR